MREVLVHGQEREDLAPLRHVREAWRAPRVRVAAVMRAPSKVELPFAGQEPEMVLRMVVLPAPLAPSMVTISPAGTCEAHARAGP